MVGSIPHKLAAQLETETIAAAALTLTSAGVSEAAELGGPPGVGVAQPELTPEGQRHQQAFAEASAAELQQFMSQQFTSLSLAISYVGGCAATMLCMTRAQSTLTSSTQVVAETLKQAAA